MRPRLFKSHIEPREAIMKTILSFFLFFAWTTAQAGLESLNPFLLLVPKDATNYATKMAATIKDSAECQRFKDEIMAHSKGSTLSGKDMHPIVDAKRKATEVGCAK